MSYTVVAMFVLMGVLLIAAGLYFVGFLLLACGVAVYLLDKAVTPVYNALYVPTVIPSTTDKLDEYAAECTQPKLPV